MDGRHIPVCSFISMSAQSLHGLKYSPLHLSTHLTLTLGSTMPADQCSDYLMLIASYSIATKTYSLSNCVPLAAVPITLSPIAGSHTQMVHSPRRTSVGCIYIGIRHRSRENADFIRTISGMAIQGYVRVRFHPIPFPSS